MRATTYLAGAAIVLGATTFVAHIALDPFDPSEDKAMTRYLSSIPLHVGTTILAILAMRHAFLVPRDIRAAVLSMGIGLSGFALGNWVWFAYNLTGWDAPYPSLADVGYLAFPVCAVIAGAILFRATRRRVQGVDLAIGVAFPLTVILVFYATLIQPRFDARTDLLRTTLDLAYPTLDAVYVGIAGLVLFFGRPGPLTPAFRRVSAAMLVYAVADFSILVTIDQGTYFSGSWADILYLIASLGFGAAVLTIPLAQHRATASLVAAQHAAPE